MYSIGWRFPPLSGGTRQGYTNNDIEGFKGEEQTDNLTRETGQNSGDACDFESGLPVKVVFELRHIPAANYAVFSGYKECIKGCRDYWGEKADAKLSRFLSDAEEMLSRDTIPVLVVSDYNTKGLEGSHSNALGTAWEALTASDGMSVKPDDNSGGSFGIGKNAPFACSALSMVFYNTYAKDEGKAFVGVARLATLFNKDGKATQRVGRYQKNDDAAESWLPIYSEDSDDFRDLFQRSSYGTDVIIVGFSQENGWFDNVTKSVLKNFFVAIAEKKLVVEMRDGVKQRTIDSTTLSQMISDFGDDKELVITQQLYKAFTTPDARESLSILEDNDAEVFIKSESNFSRTIANFRDTGMLVGLKSRRIFQHYAAVLVVRGKRLGKLLKDTEPPRHNRWDYKLINGSSQEEKDKRKTARDAIKKIDDLLLDLLKRQFEVVTEDSVDAAGVGEYIPDDLDGLGGASEGDDILRVKVKIGKIKTAPTKPGTISIPGVKAEGAELPGQVHNHEVNPTPPPPGPHNPRVVNSDDLEGEQKQGAKPGKGTKTVTVPNLSAQRAFPINSAMGLYKIVIKPTETYKNLYVSCSALGEDGKRDLLEMETFTYNGAPVPIKDGKAGPIKAEANTPAIFFVKFKNKEKMVLNLHIAEVPKR